MLRKIQRRFILAAMAAFGTVMFLIVAGINLANYIQTTSRQDHLAMSLLEGHGLRGPARPGKGGAARAGRDGAEGPYGNRDGDWPEEFLEDVSGSQGGGQSGELSRAQVGSQPGELPEAQVGSPSGELPGELPGGPPEGVQGKIAGDPLREFMRNLPGAGPEAEFTIRFFTVVFDSFGEVEEISRDYIASVDDETAAEYGRTVFLKGRDRGYFGDYRYVVRRDEAGTAILFLNSSMHLQFMKSLFFVSSGIGIFSLLLVFLLVVFFSRYAVRPYIRNMERQKRFITDAGHELKTPITSIATSADIAAMEHEGDEWIANIQKQAARLARLAGDLVALSRLDEETPFPEKCRFSLSDAAWEAAEPFEVLAKAGGKHYSQNIQENVEYYGDRDSVQKIISILLDNGVKYSDEGGKIRLDVCKRRGKVWIEVFNTCSLPDGADLNRLFDRFYRMDESRSAGTGGTGIGLSMAQAIAEACGGRIEVRRVGENGICFKAGL